MSVARQTGHRTLANPCMPYVTFSSPTSKDPQVFAGQNILNSWQNIMERFPGFSAGIESTVVAMPATSRIVRTFAWKKWDTTATTGSYYWMMCVTDTTLTTSKVYKMEVGVDASFTLIHTDSASSQPFDFIAGNNTCFFGNGTTQDNMRAFDGVTATTTTRLWGIAAPTAAPGITSITAGSLTGYVGYVYFQTYGNSSNGNESSPSPVSACTGLFTGGQVNVNITASTDPQVDQIHVYRSVDGGSKAPEDCAEITGSPYTNVSGNVPDQTLDADLGLRFAPAAYRNDPPPPSRRFASFSNRIWSAANNMVYFSGFEEIVNGVDEECWPGGGDGNFYPYPSQVYGLAGLDSLIVVATAYTMYGIDGDSLDSFRRYTVSVRNGVKNNTNISTLSLEPGTVLAAWLDTAGTVWMMGQGEIGLPIRPDLATIDQSRSALTFHITGERRWLLVSDAANGRVFPYDLDTKMWMPPRLVTANSMHSGETSIGVYDLCIGHSSGKVLKLVEGSYNDNGSTYSSHIVTNLFNMTPDQNPQWRGVCDHIAVESDSVQPDTVSICTDEDPRAGSFTVATGVDADLRTQGISLKEKYYKFNTPAARRVAFRLAWNAADANFQVYGLDVSFHPVGT